LSQILPREDFAFFTPGWSKGSTFINFPMMMVSSMKCIISAPMWNSSTWRDEICAPGGHS